MLAAARTMAGLGVRELADAAGVNKTTIVSLEQRDVIEVVARKRHGYTSAAVWDRIVAALGAHGVELVPATAAHGSACRLKRAGAETIDQGLKR